ncbi:hypothetical protein [Halopseudomonas xiamenensis]|uniref:hypothetical protein n=1 Tax=Halopseudomonas xiamenensis TaxID=157792 RepID=UPI00162A5E70|nr:hypothetical protein [Halopseudomonas xiamenensis]
MKTIVTIFTLIFALNFAATVHAEDGSMRYREMVEKLREQNKERREAEQEQEQEQEQENEKQVNQTKKQEPVSTNDKK